MKHLMSPPPFVHRKRYAKPTSLRIARPRHALPRVQPLRLRGRNVSPRERVLSPYERRLPDILLALFFIALSLAVNLEALPTTPTHPDESRWLNRAYYARDLADPFGPTWQDYVTTRGQPPLGSVMIGLGLMIQGKDVDTVKVWDFSYGRDWNERMGAVPSEEILTAGRRTNALIGALVAGAAFVLGRLMTNRIGGSLAALFVAIHPLHVILSTQALSDQTLALLLMLTFISAWGFAQKPTWTRAILLGILLGLGGSVKLTPLLLSVPLAGFGVLRLLTDRGPRSRAYGMKLLWQPAIALAAFVASYPFLWPAPIRRTWDLYAFRAGEMAEQGEAWPNAAVTSPLDALGRFGQQLTEKHSSTRWLLQIAFDRLGIDRVPVGYDFIPAVAGVVILLWWTFRRGLWTPSAIVAMLMLAEAATLVLGMKTDFYRYHLPIVVIMAGCIGVSTGVAWDGVLRLWVRRQWQPAARSVPSRLEMAPQRQGAAPKPTSAYTRQSAQEAPQR